MSDIWKNIVKDLLTALYNIPDCGCGGCAHVVTDDLNVSDSDIDFIVKFAKVHAYAPPEAPLVICLGEYLRRLTVDERRSVLREWWDEYWRRRRKLLSELR